MFATGTQKLVRSHRIFSEVIYFQTKPYTKATGRGRSERMKIRSCISFTRSNPVLSWVRLLFLLWAAGCAFHRLLMDIQKRRPFRWTSKKLWLEGRSVGEAYMEASIVMGLAQKWMLYNGTSHRSKWMMFLGVPPWLWKPPYIYGIYEILWISMAAWYLEKPASLKTPSSWVQFFLKVDVSVVPGGKVRVLWEYLPSKLR